MTDNKKQHNPLFEIEEKAVRKVSERRDTYSQKYPAVFAVGATFGLVSTLYGFEKLIDQTAFLQNNPWVLLAIGLTTLGITGSFYNKLR